MKYLKALLILTLLNYSLTFHHDMIDFLLSHQPKESFKYWHLVTQRPYDLNSEEGLLRYKIFKKTLLRIKEVNSKDLPYKLGLNEFSDLTNEEFRKTYLTYKSQENLYNENEDMTVIPQGHEDNGNVYNFDALAKQEELLSAMRLTNDYSWAHLFEKKADQGGCGSCWAFSSTGLAEAEYKKKYGDFVYLSKQTVLDCVGKTDGCDGGNERQALGFMIRNGNVLESQVPYRQRKGICKFWDYNCQNKIKAFIKLTGYDYCDDMEYSKIKCSYAWFEEKIKRGPIAVSLDASDQDFKDFRTGILIMNTSNCQRSNHAIMMIGMNKEYATIRNSWNKWGDEMGHGKVKILYDTTKNCNLFKEGYSINDILKLR